ncbi:MAG: hypothetical protein WCD18_06590 [Thermosynechococcaceae cyanobacterium]
MSGEYAEREKRPHRIPEQATYYREPDPFASAQPSSPFVELGAEYAKGYPAFRRSIVDDVLAAKKARETGQGQKTAVATPLTQGSPPPDRTHSPQPQTLSPPGGVIKPEQTIAPDTTPPTVDPDPTKTAASFPQTEPVLIAQSIPFPSAPFPPLPAPPNLWPALKQVAPVIKGVGKAGGLLLGSILEGIFAEPAGGEAELEWERQNKLRQQQQQS